ncbi:MAG TPA: YqhA family protein, partial [Acidimicrobiales bacterium]|nr:YqhA family protein [Acidimicrobiales bacterium]
SLAAIGSFVYGTAVFVHGIQEVIDHPFPVGNKIGLFALIIDLFLIGATLMIAAVGFYELFVGRIGGGREVPAWLKMSDLNDLKARVLSMVILVVAVSFVEVVVDFPAGVEVLQVGAGAAAVIVALTIYLRLGAEGRGGA